MVRKEDMATTIKRIRGQRTQKECAERAGIDRPTWNQYEKGHSMPSERNFPKILTGLDIDEEEFDRVLVEVMLYRLEGGEEGTGIPPYSWPRGSGAGLLTGAQGGNVYGEVGAALARALKLVLEEQRRELLEELEARLGDGSAPPAEPS